LIQGCLFLPGVTAVDDVVKSSAVCVWVTLAERAVKREAELVSDLDAVCQEGWN
jgi:hypothetical protein